MFCKSIRMNLLQIQILATNSTLCEDQSWLLPIQAFRTGFSTASASDGENHLTRTAAQAAFQELRIFFTFSNVSYAGILITTFT